ncbi:MAG: hypothetical protein JKY56_06505 [Kofleriaceae bacterium]|nr:hypothetical protein [Kofleriaceae bacterium]
MAALYRAAGHLANYRTARKPILNYVQLSRAFSVDRAMSANPLQWNWPTAIIAPIAAKRYRPYLLALVLGGGATVIMALLLSSAGRSLRTQPDYSSNRFCDGACICDGGVADAELMQRVCPQGWEPVYRSAKRKARQARRKARQLRRERKRAEQALIPSV